MGAPSISFKVNEAVVFEDGFIIIDAEDSSGGSSSIDTIDIVQTSGPEAKRLSNRNHLHWLYLAPDFDIDTEEVISFEITATNYGGLTTREAFDVTVIGRSGEGTIVGQYDPPLDLLVGTGPSTTTRMSYETVIAKQPASESFNAGKEELKFPGASYPGDSFTKVDYSRERIIQSEELFNDIASIERGFMGLFSVFADSLSIMNQVDNRLDWVVLDDQNITGPDEEDDRQFRLYDSIDIESPCFLAPIISRPQDFVLIGQKDVGFSIVKLTEISNEEGKTRGFDTETILTFGEGRSFCHFLQIGTRGQLPNEDFRLPWLLAVDYNSNDLVLLSYSTEDESYEINEIIPLDTGTDKTLKVVKAYSKGSPSQSPRAMIILLADDTHDGNHRLILYAQDSQTRQFVQTSIDLGDGIPSELLIGNYGGTRAEDQFAEDLVVIKRTSSTAEFFDDIGTNTMTTVDNPIFVKAGEFEVGEGVGSAVSVEHRATGTSLEQILLSFPETGELRLVTVDPENDPEVDPYR